MLDKGAVPPMAEAVDAAKDYLRLDENGEDALVAGLVVGAIEQCEAAVGTVLIVRVMRETLTAGAGWRWLGAVPVRSITGVVALANDGSESAMAADAYEIDLDSEARGRVRLTAPVESGRIVVRYEAGRFGDWGAIPMGLRHGMLRLVSHWYANRDRTEVPPLPTAIEALWAPERRLRLI